MQESIAKVVDQQVAKTNCDSLSFFSQASVITTEAITSQMKKKKQQKNNNNNTNHWVLHLPLIALKELKLVSDSQATHAYACHFYL